MLARRIALALAFAAAATMLHGGAGAAASCGRQVRGGSTDEQAAVGRILCLMPGTAIQAVELLDQAPDARPQDVWLAITIPSPPRAGERSFLGYTRATWEAELAAAAIRDGLSRLGLAHVVAFQDLAPGQQSDPAHLFGIARPEWKLPRWSAGPPARTLGRGVGMWGQLQAKLDGLSRRFGVQTKLERFDPFGKAPIVVVTTPRGGAFIDAGGFQTYEQALRFRDATYDGVLLELLTPSGAGLQVFTIDRGRRSSGCSRFGTIPHRRYEICPSD